MIDMNKNKIAKTCPVFARPPVLTNVKKEVKEIIPINYGKIVYDLIFKRQSGEIRELVKSYIIEPKLYRFVRDLTKPYLDFIWDKFFKDKKIPYHSSKSLGQICITNKILKQFCKDNEITQSISGTTNKDVKMKRILEYIWDFEVDRIGLHSSDNYFISHLNNYAKFHIKPDNWIAVNGDFHNMQLVKYCKWSEEEKEIFDRLFNFSIHNLFATSYQNFEYIPNAVLTKDISVKEILTEDYERADMLLKKIWFSQYDKTNNYVSCLNNKLDGSI